MKKKNKFRLAAGTKCEIFRQADCCSPLYCMITEVTEDWISCMRMEGDGEFSGISVFRHDSIWRVRLESKLVQGLFREKREEASIKAPRGGLNARYFSELSELYGSITLYCEAQTNEECFIGEFVEADGDVIVIDEFRPADSQERTRLIISIEEVTRIEAGGDYEKRILGLY